MTAPVVVGLDLSLTATGIASTKGWSETLKPTGMRAHQRLAWLHAALRMHIPATVDLVVVEGPAYSRQAGQSGHHERAGLWWLITHRLLWGRDVPFAVAPPTSRARYATGRGNAGKDEVLLACDRRFGHLIAADDNNAADAVVLAAMGADWLGHPLVDMPAANRKALDGVEWPEMGLRATESPEAASPAAPDTVEAS